MDLRLAKFPIQQGKAEDWRVWCEQLNDRKDEVMETLVKEDVYIESCFMDDDYVYIIMVMPDYEEAASSGRDEPFPIDLEHRVQRRNALNPPTELERLFHFVNNSALPKE